MFPRWTNKEIEQQLAMTEQDVLDSMCINCRGIPFDEQLPFWVFDEWSECKCGHEYLPSPAIFAYEDLGVEK